MEGVSRSVQLDVVELLKQVLQWTPLYKPGLNKGLLQAAKVGSLGCVKALLSAGAIVDTEDEQGDTPFVLAFRGQHLEVMEALHEAGANTEIANLSVAIAAGDVEFVKRCLQMDVPVENEDWNTANEAELNILLKDLNLDPFSGQYGYHGYEDSPFMYLSQEGRPETLQQLVEHHPSISQYTQDQLTSKMNQALHKAVKYRRLENVKVLLTTLGAELEALDRQGRTAFMSACEYDEPTAHYLLDHGAQTLVEDHEGLTCLHWAACVGFRKLSAALITRGCCVDARARLGATPLMVACSGGHLDIAQLLLHSGAEINSQTPEGWAALHVAVWACAPGVARLLLRSGAQPNVKSTVLTHNSDPVPASTPLLIALCLNSTRITRHLLDAGCDINLKGPVRVKRPKIKDDHKLLENNSTPNTTDTDDTTTDDDCFIVIDIDKRRQKIKQEEVDIVNDAVDLVVEDQSPLQYALYSRSWDLAVLLVRAGAKVGNVNDLMASTRQGGGVLPRDRLATIRRMLQDAVSNPPSLLDLSRQLIRKQLVSELPDKVEQLPLSLALHNLLLFHDLFQAPEGRGSFEV